MNTQNAVNLYLRKVSIKNLIPIIQIIIENKKKFNMICSDDLNECDSSIGLFCQGEDGNKKCGYVET